MSQCTRNIKGQKVNSIEKSVKMSLLFENNNKMQSLNGLMKSIFPIFNIMVSKTSRSIEAVAEKNLTSLLEYTF